jgi:hypothetical protein
MFNTRYMTASVLFIIELEKALGRRWRQRVGAAPDEWAVGG